MTCSQTLTDHDCSHQTDSLVKYAAANRCRCSRSVGFFRCEASSRLTAPVDVVHCLVEDGQCSPHALPSPLYEPPLAVDFATRKMPPALPCWTIHNFRSLCNETNPESNLVKESSVCEYRVSTTPPLKCD